MSPAAPRPGRILSAQDAERAVYFDFETLKGEPPSLLGWSYLRDDGAERFEQWLVEPLLWPAAPVKVPHTDGRVNVHGRSLNAAVRALVEIAEAEYRLLVSWSEFDLLQIREHAAPELAGRCASVYRNALPTVRQWRKHVRPDAEIDRTFRGKNRLPVYAELMRVHIPEKYAQNVAANGIREMRAGIAESGSFTAATQEQRRAFKALLGHNRIDCGSARQIVMRAAEEYAEARASQRA